MLRTGVAVTAIGIVAVLLVAGVGGVTADEPAVDSEMDRTEAVQEVGEVEIIVEDRAGNRLQGIDVTATWDDGESNEDTSSAGRALLDVPMDTVIEFRVNDPNDEYVKNHQPVEVDGAVGEQITIEMAERGEMELTVTDPNEEPVEDVRLRLFHDNDNRIVDTVFTDEDGVAVVSGIEQRTYDVDTSRAGYRVTEEEVELDSAVLSESIEIVSARVNVDFTVLDDANHLEEPRPLEGAVIDIEDFGTLPPTFSDGTQDQSLPVNDEYQVTVQKEGYQDRTRTLEVGEEATSLVLRTQRTPSISVEQLQSSIVVGQPTQVTVTDAYNLPVEGASVSVNGEEIGQTNEVGQIVFNITETGENQITASSRGRTASETVVGVDPSDDDDSDDTDDDDSMDDSEEDDDTDADEGGEDDTSDDDTGDEDTGDEDTGDEDTGDDAIGPGFGVLVAVVTVLGAALIAARRR